MRPRVLLLDRELSPQHPQDGRRCRGCQTQTLPSTGADPLRVQTQIPPPAGHPRAQTPSPRPVQPHPRLTAALCSREGESAGWVDSPGPYRNEAHLVPFHLLHARHTQRAGPWRKTRLPDMTQASPQTGAAPTLPPWEGLAWGVGPRACPHSLRGSVTVQGFNRAEWQRPAKQEEPRHRDLSVPSL